MTQPPPYGSPLPYQQSQPPQPDYPTHNLDEVSEPPISDADVDDELDRRSVLVRRITAVVLALAAVGIWFALAPTSTDVKGAVTDALATDRLSQSQATSAPQQQVVNGWVARDLLAITARESAAPHDERVPAEMMLGVLGIAALIVLPPRRS